MERFLLEFGAEDGVEAAEDEEDRHDGDEEEVSHDTPPRQWCGKPAAKWDETMGYSHPHSRPLGILGELSAGTGALRIC